MAAVAQLPSGSHTPPSSGVLPGSTTLHQFIRLNWSTKPVASAHWPPRMQQAGIVCWQLAVQAAPPSHCSPASWTPLPHTGGRVGHAACVNELLDVERILNSRAPSFDACPP